MHSHLQETEVTERIWVRSLEDILPLNNFKNLFPKLKESPLAMVSNGWERRPTQKKF